MEISKEQSKELAEAFVQAFGGKVIEKENFYYVHIDGQLVDPFSTEIVDKDYREAK